MASIPEAVDSLKGSIKEALAPEQVIAACREAGHHWRVRTLDPVNTVWLFVLQILHGNTACTHVARLLPGRPVTDSAYCQARSRLPLRVFTRLFHRMARGLQMQAAGPGWHGRRVLQVDGTCCSMPDTKELDRAFGHPPAQAAGCSFPVMHLLGLLESGTGFLIDLVPSPLRTHDARAVRWVHRHLHRGDILVGDRAFSGFAHLALLMRRGVDGLFRQHQCRRTDFRRGRVLGVEDRLVKIRKGQHAPAWMLDGEFERLPNELMVRIVRYRLEARGYRTRELTLVTTLQDQTAYPKEELAQLYGERWEIEVNFRHLKQTLGLDVLKCKTVDGVLKELYTFGMAYNLVRALMVEASQHQGVPPDRISFVDVLRWLAERRPHEPMPRFAVNPLRPGRHRPRIVKRRPKQYPRMQPCHLAQVRAAIAS